MISYGFLLRPLPCTLDDLSASYRSMAAADLAALGEMLRVYAFDRGRYPAVLEELLVADPEGFYQPTYSTIPLDPWGHPYRYASDLDGTSFELTCLGRDGEPGGTGDAADSAVASSGTR